MSFAEKQLQTGEEIKLQTNQHIVVLLPELLITVGVFIGVIGLAGWAEKRWGNPNVYWLMVLLVPFLYNLVRKIIIRANEEYIVTNRRVIKQEGVFTKSSFDASLDKVNNIFHTQTVLGRLLNYGDVGLETASQMGLTQFRYIPDPLGFKNMIEAEREKRTRYLPSIEPSPYQSKEDIVGMLERLGKLRDSKVITEEEFQEGKRKLLNNL